MHKDILLSNIDKIHTTTLGKERIRKNLKLDVNNIIDYIKNKILDNKSVVYKKGKNYYVEIDNLIITINSYNYSVITAHKEKEVNI